MLAELRLLKGELEAESSSARIGSTKPGKGRTTFLVATGILAAGAAYYLSRPAFPIEPANQKSIAVLPFADLSPAHDQQYFCDGMQDEILTRLSMIADLKVISHTSTLGYKSVPKNLPEIARQLGVAHILEGSVQKSNERVRVNVQLIKGATDTHLWAVNVRSQAN